MKHQHMAMITATMLFIFVLMPSVQAQDQLKDIRVKIEEINKKMDKAVLEGDYETQLSFFTDDLIIDHPLEPPIKGKDAFRANAGRNRREGVKYHSFSGTIEDLWTCDDRIYERGSWGMSFTTNRLKQPVAAYGSYFQIWTKHGEDSYRIQYLIFTLDFNPYDIGR